MSEFIEIPASKMSTSRRKPLFGMGINDANYITQPKIGSRKKTCPFYKVWINMLSRCYCEDYHNTRPTYKDCEVIEDWLLFSSFKNWMKSQVWQGRQLDKDIKIIGNKIYSPSTCLFVSDKINTLLLDCGSSRGFFPIGVTFDKRKNKFLAQCRHEGRNNFLGYYSSASDAHNAYKKFKNKVIIEVANQPESAYIKQYLLNHASHLLGKSK